jgi:hypothetical protein
LDRKQRFYVWLTAIFVAALITSDLHRRQGLPVWGLDLAAG